MDFVGVSYFQLENNTQVIAATRWCGKSIGQHDVMEVFFASDGACPIDAPKGLRFNWSSYHCEVMGDSDALYSAFAQWLKDHSENAVIAVAGTEYEVLRRLSDARLIDFDNFECVVNIDEVTSFGEDIYAYAKRHNIRPCMAMSCDGGEPIWQATVKAMSYRLLLSAIGLHERRASEIALIKRYLAMI